MCDESNGTRPIVEPLPQRSVLSNLREYGKRPCVVICLIMVGCLGTSRLENIATADDLLSSETSLQGVPQLPESLMDKTQIGEERLEEAMKRLDKMTIIEQSQFIDLAEELCQLREKYQGPDWWESVDARWRLTYLQQWASSSPAQQSAIIEGNNIQRKGEELFREGKYQQALELVHRSIELQGLIFESQHPKYAASLGRLADLYQAQGQYEEAVSVIRQALAIEEKVLGSSHPDVATSLNKLAKLYQAQESLTADGQIQVQANQPLDPVSADVEANIEEQRELEHPTEKSAEALSLYQQALTIQETTLGPNHEAVANSLDNLGNLYQKQEEFTEAASLYQRALTIRESQLGPTDPDVASSLKNLASVAEEKEQLTDAMTLYRKALTIQGANPRLRTSDCCEQSG